jgi:hypothetical protein
MGIMRDATDPSTKPTETIAGYTEEYKISRWDWCEMLLTSLKIDWAYELKNK